MHAGGDLAVAARDSALDGGGSSEGCCPETALVDDGVKGEAGPGVGIGGRIQVRELAGDQARNVESGGGDDGRERECWCGRRCVLGIFVKPIS